ncbi:MAG: hypothetical protein MUC97_07950 [Bernardetiaceae bacterium]|nr:hypothetical protein [Bernardetiaceae bacterium]
MPAWPNGRTRVEKQRLAPGRLLQKADQLMLRLTGLVALAGLAWAGRRRLRAWLATRYLSSTVNPTLGGWRLGFYAATAYFTWHWWVQLPQAGLYRELYAPVLVLQVLRLPWPSPPILYSLLAVYTVLLLLAGLGWRPRATGWGAAGLFFLLQGYAQSFEKVDHGLAPWGYAMFWLPWLWEGRGPVVPAWPLWLARGMLAGAYFLAGVEKLLATGPAWVTQLPAYLTLHPTPLGLWLAQWPWLCGLLATAALLFELSFWICLVWPRARWLMLPAGVLFHLGTFTLLGAGGWVSAWWVLHGLLLIRTRAGPGWAVSPKPTSGR